MNSESLTIMLVDDNERFRTALKARLMLQNYNVVDFASGEDAIAFSVVNQASGLISYAFIDHMLQTTLESKGKGQHIDGIETTRKLTEIIPDMSIVVFSGQANISEAEQLRARMAGARRYIYKKGGIEIEQIIVDFIRELAALRELSSLAEKFLHQREQLAATLREVPVGTLLIDKEGSPWAVSRAWRQIEEKTDLLEYPIHSFTESLVNDSSRWALVERAFEGEERDELALCEVRPGRLKYLHTWARPLMNDHGQPIACSLSAVDQTGYDVLRLMSLHQRLGLIAESIQRAGYDRARLYRASEDGLRIIGVVEVGGHLSIEFERFEIVLSEASHLRSTVSRRQPYLWPIDEAEDLTKFEMKKNSSFLSFPLFDDESLVGWLSVDMEFNHKDRPLSEKDIARLKPYAEEATRAFIEAPRVSDHHEPSSEGLAGVWAAIERCTNPNEAMQIIVTAVQNLTGCSALIRVIQKNSALMVAKAGEFPNYRPIHIPTSSLYWGERVLQHRRPIIVQGMNVPEKLFSDAEIWSETAKEVFDCIKAFAIFPLTFGTTFGMLSIQSQNADHFTHQQRNIFQSLSRVAAMAWIDLTRAQDRQTLAQQEMAFTTVHNLRQPTTALRGALTRILKRDEKGELSVEYAVDATRDALRYLKRSEDIITGVLRYMKPLDLRMHPVNLQNLLESIKNELLRTHEKLKVILQVPLDVVVRGDIESLRQVFEELFGNALRVMNGAGTISVSAFLAQLTDDNGQIIPGVQVEIEDDGPGILPQVADKIFEPFVTTAAAGTGLGLAFVKNVIEGHNGKIWYEPVPQHGTRFILNMPVALKEGSGGE